MPGFQNDQTDEDDLFEQVSAMADRMKMEDPARRAKYIDDHMIQAGYQRVQTRESYAKIQAEEEETEGPDAGGWFGRPARRPVGGGGGGGGNRQDGDRF